MKVVSTIGVVIALLGGQASVPSAQPSTWSARTPIDVSKLGPQVGERVPDFSLKDQNGTVWTLQSIMGPKGAMLVFYRSADWCPYCKTELIDLQSRVNELKAQGYGLAAISYDGVPVLADFSKRRGITFPLLSDAGSATIEAVRDSESHSRRSTCFLGLSGTSEGIGRLADTWREFLSSLLMIAALIATDAYAQPSTRFQHPLDTY